MRQKFEDILDIINGKNQKKVENPNGKYPIYGSGGVMGYADDYLCEANTVVIGRKGSINNPIYVEESFWNVDTAFGLVARKNVLLPRYLYFFCIHFDFDKLNTTVTIPSLTKANILKIEMDVPNIGEQKKIVDKLDSIVKLIQLQKEQIEKLDTLVKAQFVEMFGDIFVTDSFPLVQLSELADIGSSKRIYANEYVGEGIPFYRSKEVRELGTGLAEMGKVLLPTHLVLSQTVFLPMLKLPVMLIIEADMIIWFLKIVMNLFILKFIIKKHTIRVLSHTN